MTIKKITCAKLLFLGDFISPQVVLNISEIEKWEEHLNHKIVISLICYVVCDMFWQQPIAKGSIKYYCWLLNVKWAIPHYSSVIWLIFYINDGVSLLLLSKIWNQLLWMYGWNFLSIFYIKQNNVQVEVFIHFFLIFIVQTKTNLPKLCLKTVLSHEK